MAIGYQEVRDVLGGDATLGDVRSPLDLHRHVTAGLPFRSLELLCDRADVAPSRFASSIGIPSATFDRRRISQRLDARESELVSRVARILLIGANIFGSISGTWKWLGRPNRAFGSLPPIELLRSEDGGREVEASLMRRLYGGYD